MIIKTKQIKGEGRGRELGFPTINMIVPDDIHMEEGVYAGWFDIDGNIYKSAIHFGAVPTFGQREVTLEAHLIDIIDDNMPYIGENSIELDIVEKIREVENFSDIEDLIIQIDDDVNKARFMLK